MPKKNTILVTGGAGFVGTNIILRLVNKTNYNIISIDNYSSGKKTNHINNKRVRYLNGNTSDISKLIKDPLQIKLVFHLGEFARIYQSFLKMNECIKSNTIGSTAVFNFCLRHNIKLIYSATSASLGNRGKDKNLSPYAFSKAKNLELLENLKKWFNLKYEVVYFYNVYGPYQISKGDMATVIGIFQNQFKKKLSLTVVKPGTQSRRFTHIDDTVDACFYAWKKNLCKHYVISNKKSFRIIDVAKMFGSKIKFLPAREGERYVSSLTKSNLNNKFVKLFGKKNLKDYVKNFIQNN
tara:strand:+ start:859 stop:1743 length:885 start_codon:yes stop_codon:yes gene_type:complete